MVFISAATLSGVPKRPYSLIKSAADSVIVIGLIRSRISADTFFTPWLSKYSKARRFQNPMESTRVPSISKIAYSLFMAHHLCCQCFQMLCSCSRILRCKNGRYYCNSVHATSGKFFHIGSVNAADGYHRNGYRAADLF